MERIDETLQTFLPGRKFLVRSDLDIDDMYNGIDVAMEMLDYAGRFVTVSRVDRYTNDNTVYIYIVEDGGEWCWADEMFLDPYDTYDQCQIEIKSDILMDLLS